MSALEMVLWSVFPVITGGIGVFLGMVLWFKVVDPWLDKHFKK